MHFMQLFSIYMLYYRAAVTPIMPTYKSQTANKLSPPETAVTSSSPSSPNVVRNQIDSTRQHLEELRSTHMTCYGADWTCRNVYYFAVSYGLILMLRSALTHFLQHISQPLKQRYFLPDINIDFIMGCQKVRVSRDFP